MKKFLKNAILFLLLGSLAVIPLFYWIYGKIITPESENACYVWGDSQMCEGLDVTYLNSKNKRKFFSCAQPAAGVYDFLVFTELVPENAFVIISNSRPVLLRPLDRDKNLSVLDIPSLYQLIKNNYSLSEVLYIAQRNLKFHGLFYEKYEQQRNTDSAKKNLNVPEFEGAYNKRSEYLEDKKNLYLQGVQNLKDKNCTIVSLAFPFHPNISGIEKRSLLRTDLEEFDVNFEKFFENKETMVLNDSLNVFYDMTHLNKRGARQISEALNHHLPSQSTFIKITLGRE